MLFSFFLPPFSMWVNSYRKCTKTQLYRKSTDHRNQYNAVLMCPTFIFMLHHFFSVSLKWISVADISLSHYVNGRFYNVYKSRNRSD